MVAEYVFLCNSLHCRQQLEGQAVVTTCCHIFCLQCADVLGLTRASNGRRICPACKTKLDNPDDCAVALLDPSEDYKGSILCGLAPSDIMECATKALEFFTYQATQEIAFQTHARGKATQSCANYKTELVRQHNEANGKLDELYKKLQAATAHIVKLNTQNEQLRSAFTDKSKALADLSKKYTVLRQHAELDPRLAAAAAEEAEQDVDTAVMEELHTRQDYQGAFHDYNQNLLIGTQARGYRHNGHSWQERPAGHASRVYTARKDLHQNLIPNHLQPAESVPVPMTPRNGSNYPMPQYSRSGPGNMSAHGFTRNPLNPIDPNLLNPAMSGYGMSAGVKIGRSGRPSSRTTPRIPRQTGQANMPIR